MWQKTENPTRTVLDIIKREAIYYWHWVIFFGGEGGGFCFTNKWVSWKFFRELKGGWIYLTCIWQIFYKNVIKGLFLWKTFEFGNIKYKLEWWVELFYTLEGGSNLVFINKGWLNVCSCHWPNFTTPLTSIKQLLPRSIHGQGGRSVFIYFFNICINIVLLWHINMIVSAKMRIWNEKISVVWLLFYVLHWWCGFTNVFLKLNSSIYFRIPLM